jgi:hypothetical protein
MFIGVQGSGFRVQRFWVQGSEVLGSAQPLAKKKTVDQIEKETLQFHTSAASGLKNGQSDRKRN